MGKPDRFNVAYTVIGLNLQISFVNFGFQLPGRSQVYTGSFVFKYILCKNVNFVNSDKTFLFAPVFGLIITLAY